MGTRRLLAVAMTVAACGGTASRPVAGPSALPLRAGPLSARHVGAIQLLHIELPDAGTVIGGRYAGQLYATRRATFTLGEAARRRLSILALMQAESALAAAGFTVRRSGPRTGEARPLAGVRFALTGRTSHLDVREIGDVVPAPVLARTEVAWELLDVAAGAPVFGQRTHGEAQLDGDIEVAVLQAIGRAAASLAADSGFLRALAAPPPRDIEYLLDALNAAPVPRPAGEVVLRETDRNPVTDGSLEDRVGAGVVTVLGSTAGEATAFLLTRDGVALTSAAAARGPRLFARFGTGVERPARVLRVHGRSGVALLHIACTESCATVDWALARLRSTTAVFAVGAPFGGGPAVFAYGELGGRWGLFSGGLLTLDAPGVFFGGEPVARALDGRVIGITIARGSAPAVMPLAEALRVLGVRVAPR